MEPPLSKRNSAIRLADLASTQALPHQNMTGFPGIGGHHPHSHHAHLHPGEMGNDPGVALTPFGPEHMVQTNALKLSPSQPVQSHPEAQTAASFTSSQTTVGFPVAHPHTGYTTSRDFILRRELSASAMHALGDQHSSALLPSSPWHVHFPNRCLWARGRWCPSTFLWTARASGPRCPPPSPPPCPQRADASGSTGGHLRQARALRPQARALWIFFSAQLQLHELKCEPRHSSSRSHGGVFCDTCGSPSSKSSSASGLTRSRRPRSPAPKLSAPCTSSSTMSRWSTSGDRSRAVTSASGKSVRARERRLKPSTN